MQEEFRDSTNEALANGLDEMAFDYRLKGQYRIAQFLNESAVRIRTNFYVPEDDGMVAQSEAR